MKILCLGDLHFGEKGNSEKFQKQILEFIDWVCELQKYHTIDYVVQHGDYYHNRHKIDVSSLEAGLVGARKLSNAYGKDRVFVLKGNHDLYYLDRLDISSINALNEIVTVVEDEYELAENVLVVPWITDTGHWENVIKDSENFDYVLGHFEFNNFKVNEGYVMSGGVSHRELKHCKRVITGHYHSFQQKDNVTYLGTPYPITMNEANEQHGVCILDTETDELEFIEYEKVKVISMDYETFLDSFEDTEYDPENTSIRIEFPDDLEDETVVSEISDVLGEMNFSSVKTKYTPTKVKEILEADVDVENVDDIDELVINFIKDSKEINGIDKKRLTKIYNTAITLGTR